MTKMTDLDKVKRLYRSFTGREPTRVKRVATPRIPKALMVLGYCDFIGYTIPGGSRFKHNFATGSRPLLCSDGKKLYLIHGRYRVTSRGIVDLDRLRREEA